MANDQALVLRFGVDIGQTQKQLADLSRNVSQNMEAISKVAGKSSGDVASGLAKMGDAAQTVQQRLRDLSSFSGFTKQLDLMIAKTAQAQTQLQQLQGRFQGVMTQFQSGQGKGAGDIGQMLLQAGSLRGAIGMAGGPLGAAALVGGAAYGQIQQFAAIGDLAEKARASAQEIEGLDRVLGKLGIDATSANGMIGTFADKLQNARQFGGELKTELDNLGISLTNSDGSARSAVAVLGDLSSRIKNTTDESEKLRLATLAVGDQLAGPFLTAINQSKTGLADLASASKAAGSSFTNDLAKGAQAAMGALSELGKRADTVYAQIKRAIGLANDADKVKAAQADLRQAEGAVKNERYGQSLRQAVRGEDPTQEDKDKLAALSLDVERKRFALQGIDDTNDKADAMRKALAKSYGPQMPADGMPNADDDDSGGGSGRRGGGGSSAAAKQEDDRAQRVLDRLKERLAATQAVSDETGTLGEKQRIVAELVNAGVAAESEMGQQIADTVRQIDAQVEAQRRHAAAMNEVRAAANSVESALDSWIVQGNKFGDVLRNLMKQLESQALKGVFNQLTEGSSGGKSSGGGAGGLFGLISKMFGGGSGKSSEGYDPTEGEEGFDPFEGLEFANGGVMTSRGPLPLRRYAAGGIANSAQLAMIGEGSMSEAYVPLPDGRSIPVNMKLPTFSTPQAPARPAGGGDYRPNINNTFHLTGVTSPDEVKGWIGQGMAQAHASALRDVPGALRSQQDRSW